MSDIFEISDRLVERIAAIEPMSATSMGVAGYDHLWGDGGQAALDAILELISTTITEIDSLAPSEDHWDLLARRVAREALDLHQSIIESGEPYRDLNSIASPAQGIRGVFDIMPTETDEHWANISARLNSISVPLDAYRSLLEVGRSRGDTVPVRQVEVVAKECRAYAEGYFDRLVAGATDRSGALREELERGAALASAEYAALAEYLEETYRPDAIDRDPVGVDRYRFATRRYLMADIDLEETYRWGWEEIVRLRAEMEDLAEEISPGAGLDAVMDLLQTDPARAAGTPEEFLERMTALQRDAVERLEGLHFDLPAEVKPLDVRLAPPGGALGAHYTGPSEDFSRPGTVWYSPGAKTEFPLYDEVSTAYHEGFPGHHYQIAMATYLAENLSRFHRLAVWYPGYGEGWALYTEQLMGELGFYDQPDYELGLRINQVHRACRVAIDIGVHCGFPIPADAPFHPGEEWTFDSAVGLLRSFAYLNPAYAESEVTRYLGWPGQAISYKVGERVILGLRDEFMGRPGATLKEFHARVVGSGTVGLDHLRELVLG